MRRLALVVVPLLALLAACGTLIGSSDEPSGGGPIVPEKGADASSAPEAGDDAASDADADVVDGSSWDAGPTSDCTGWSLCDTFERAGLVTSPWGEVNNMGNDAQLAVAADATRGSRVFDLQVAARNTSGDAYLETTTLPQPGTQLVFETWLRVMAAAFPNNTDWVQLVYLDCSISGTTNGAFLVGVDHRGVYVNVGSTDTVIAASPGAWQRVAVTVSTLTTTVVVDGVVKYAVARNYSANSGCTLDLGVGEESGNYPSLHIEYDDVRYRAE